MNIDFTNIEYLKKGSKRQQQAFEELTKLSIFQDLQRYHPILTGTIPIGIDLPESDLDIICECSDHNEFAEVIKSLYSNKNNFEIRTSIWNELTSTIAKFRSGEFEIEIFGQDKPTQLQSAYRHMIVEHQILNSKDDEFRTKIIRLKQKGLKTEPAFAKVLGLNGDPYQELLKLEQSN